MKSFEKNETEMLFFNDVKNEIFDMVKPIEPTCITFKDLILRYVWLISTLFSNFFYFNSGQGSVVAGILTDSNKFWTYENRDILLNDVSEESEKCD